LTILRPRLCRAFFDRTGEDEGFDHDGLEICAGSIHARGSNVTYVGWDSKEEKFAEVERERIKGRISLMNIVSFGFIQINFFGR